LQGLWYRIFSFEYLLEKNSPAFDSLLTNHLLINRAVTIIQNWNVDLTLPDWNLVHAGEWHWPRRRWRLWASGDFCPLSLFLTFLVTKFRNKIRATIMQKIKEKLELIRTL